MEQVKPRWRRKALVVVALVVVAAALVYVAPIVVGLCQWVYWGTTVYYEQPFDRELWLSYDKSSDPRIRAHMYDDLRKNHLKIGMSRKEVLKLLGKPALDHSGILYYDLGPDAIGIDTDRLVIELDESGRIKRVGLTQT